MNYGSDNLLPETLDQLLFWGSFLRDADEPTQSPPTWDEIDSQALTEAAVRTHLAPVIHENVASLGILSAQALETLGNIRNQVLVQNIRIYSAFGQLQQGFNAHGIPFVPLKGIYAAEKLYEDISLRHLSDIDLLVKEANAGLVCRMAESLGWSVKMVELKSRVERDYLAPAHPYKLLKDGITVELHTHIHDMSHRGKLSAEQLWEHTAERAFLNGKIHQFDAEMLLQHWCLHLYKHLCSDHVKMASFVDIHLLLQKEGALNWQLFSVLCQRYGCEGEAYKVLFLCKKYWHVNVPDAHTLPDFKLEEYFLRFLHGFTTTSGAQMALKLRRNMKRMNAMQSPSRKTGFLLGFLFPRQAFMRQHYGLSAASRVWPYYAIRLIHLGGKLLRAISNKVLTTRISAQP